MAPKRRRRLSPAPQGLAPGERLKRQRVIGNYSSPWSWVGTEVSNPSDIDLDHRLATCGLSKRSSYPFCINKYSIAFSKEEPPSDREGRSPVRGELEDDVIIISDDEESPCSKKLCKTNPNCLNYLGQDIWEDEGLYAPREPDIHLTPFMKDIARNAFLEAWKLEDNPLLDARDPDLPVGLKVHTSLIILSCINLSSTFPHRTLEQHVMQTHFFKFVSSPASLQLELYIPQVWFRDLAFRSGVYRCQPSQDTEHMFEVASLR
jgi:hypothetical protein